jgi:hypothetical protein
MLKTSLFCTFLADLRHENPVLKIENQDLFGVIVELRRERSLFLLRSYDSRESRKHHCYCRFTADYSALTVANPEMFLATAVFE